MTSILFFIAGIALGFYIKGRVKRDNKTFTPKQVEELDEMREEAHEALTERTEKRKGKILDFIKNEVAHQEDLKNCNLDDSKIGVTSADIEKLLDISNDTARRYLNELEGENKIKQIGKSGRGVYYILNP